MIPLALALVSGLAAGPALDLDTITLQQAAVLDGRMVRASVTVANPPATYGLWSVLGDDTGAVTRTVVVPRAGRVGVGDVVTVVGVLEVVRHPAVMVNGVNVPGWDEVRVTGVRMRWSAG